MEKEHQEKQMNKQARTFLKLQAHSRWREELNLKKKHARNQNNMENNAAQDSPVSSWKNKRLMH